MARDYNIKTSAVDPSKYVYRQERDITKTDVDWTKVTKDLTTTIETIRDDRETRKAEIEEATTTAINDMAEMEQYDSESLNVKVLEGSHWGSEFLASQNSLMKRGLLKPADFMVSKQKVQDSFSQLKTALGTFDKAYIEGQKRMNSEVEGEQSTTFEQGLLLRMAGLAGLAQWDISGNPATGAMAFVKKGEDASNPANVMSLNVINQRLNQKSNYVSLSTSAADIVSTLGEEIKASFIADGQRGAILTTEDWLKKKGSKEMLATLVKQATATQNKRLSILQDVGVTAEMYTSDPKVAADNPGDGTVANPGYVLMVPVEDGQGTMTVQLTDLQKDLVDKEAEKVIKSQLDKKNEITGRLVTTYGPQDNNNTTERKEEIRKARGLYSEVVIFATGDPAASDAAGTALAAIVNDNLAEGVGGITAITRSADGSSFSVTREGGAPAFVINTMSSDNVTPKTTKQIVKELFQELNPYSRTEVDIITAEDNFDGEYGEIGQGGSSGTIRETVKEVIEATNVDMDNTYPDLGGKTPYEFMYDEVGANLQGGFDQASGVTENYTKVLNKVIPADTFSYFAEKGQRFQVVMDESNQGLLFQVVDGRGLAVLEVPVTNAWGENDSVKNDHEPAIFKLANMARDMYMNSGGGMGGF